jgi:hypothetical protein
MPHLLGMFVCNLVIAFSSMDALEATVGLAAYSATFQISRALAATILPAAPPGWCWRTANFARTASP